MQKSQIQKNIVAIGIISLILGVFVFFLTTTVYKSCSVIRKKPVKSEQAEISPTEDLMREHGLLNRLLLIYEEIIKRADKNESFPFQVLNKTITIVHTFIENYHEKLEETYIFPLFEKHGIKVALVNTLREQHNHGRAITDAIEQQITDQNPDVKQIVSLMQQFITMYRPHEAREDTELFPKLHDLVTPAEFKELGDIFEDREKELFGEHGFEDMVEKVAALEKELGIYELEQFTPQV